MTRPSKQPSQAASWYTIRFQGKRWGRIHGISEDDAVRNYREKHIYPFKDGELTARKEGRK